MSKFVIECPHCGSYAEGKTGFFARKKIDCTCGYTINVRTDKMTTRECPHCGNTVLCDQTKGTDAKCPVCHEQLVTQESMSALAEIACPSCSCKITVDKNAAGYTCPLCDTVIDVQKQIAAQTAKGEGLASLIKYEGGNDVFVWKHPIEDFNLGSQLIVHESQEAIFFKDGRALDLFGAGRYTLATQNLPLLQEIYKLPTNADTVFHSEIYFINMTTQMGVKWGTDSKVRLFDPGSGLHIEIGACGSFNIRVVNSRKLLLKVVGTASELSQNELVGGGFTTSAMVGKFKSLVMNKVKSILAKTIKEENINILEIDEHIDELSVKLRNEINITLDDYGLTLPEFFVTSIMTPDDDPNFRRLKQQFADKTLRVREEEIRKAEAEAAQGRRLVEAQTEAQLKMVGAQGEAEALKIKAMAEAEAYKAQAFAEAEEMKAKGYTYQQ
ncbi:MAG: SPFH domain-containing protein, partial [Ruminococcus sp.]|nr:SPFH domain-containing protein [Ruminococcus sp.]